jgi:hypothetical protein
MFCFVGIAHPLLPLFRAPFEIDFEDGWNLLVARHGTGGDQPTASALAMAVTIPALTALALSPCIRAA